MDEDKTEGRMREDKRRRRRRMRVVGRSVRLLQDIILRRAQKMRKKEGS